MSARREAEHKPANQLDREPDRLTDKLSISQLDRQSVRQTVHTSLLLERDVLRSFSGTVGNVFFHYL